MARQSYSVTPNAPIQYITLPWQADGLSVVNYTASPVYLIVGRHQEASGTTYDYVIPAGVSLGIPCQYQSEFSVTLGIPLNAGVTSVNLTERVDLTFVKGESIPTVSASEVARNIIQSFAYSLPAGGDLPILLDVRYARTLQISCAPTTDTGTSAVDIEFAASLAGPFTPYVSYRLPRSTATVKYVIRTIPLLGIYARIHVYEVNGLNPTAGEIFYTLSADYIPPIESAQRIVSNFGGSVAVGGSATFTLDHESGVLDTLNVRINGARATYQYDVLVFTDSLNVPGASFQYHVVLMSPFNPAISQYQTELAPYRILKPNQDAIEYLLPLNIHYATRWRIAVNNIADAAPPAPFVLNLSRLVNN